MKPDIGKLHINIKAKGSTAKGEPLHIVEIHGRFTITENDTEKFIKKLDELINEYRS